MQATGECCDQCCKSRYGVLMPAASRAQPADSVGAALRHLREQRHRSVRKAAAALGWSPSKLSRMETGATQVRPGDLTVLLDLYAVDSETRREIEALPGRDQDTAHETEALSEAYERYATLEARAAKILLYGAVIVPGLLQIPEYADAVIRATPEPEDHLAPERLKTRMVRQSVFARPVALEVVIDEAVLHRPIGGGDVMRRQMIRLREFAERPRTEIRVLPFTVGAHPALTGPFAILDFDDGGATPPHVFCDGLTGGVLRRRADDVHRYRGCFAALQKLSLGAAQSAEMFATTAA